MRYQYEAIKEYSKVVIARSSSDEAISTSEYRLLRYARNDTREDIFLQSQHAMLDFVIDLKF